MCGIVGIVSNRGSVQQELVVAMRDLLAHRGPDDAGVWLSPDRRAGLGHRRLAIIDLSIGGRQPMQLRSSHLHITFNGEIYNYRELRQSLRSLGYEFCTETDTEVILAAYAQWGERCVESLNGMFAFCIYDAERKRLFAARDRAGEKPLFYAHFGGQLLFASELKGLMAHPELPRVMNLEALDHYLAFGYVTGEACLLENVSKLPPGHTFTYDVQSDALSIRRYWSLPGEALIGHSDVVALTDELEALLGDAVKRQMVADVPVGILLSGGVDSSLVTALAAKSTSAPVRTFTITFPQSPEYNEAPFAKRVATHFGTVHEELEMLPASVDLLAKLARQFDEPIADSSMVPTFLISHLIRDHCTVALGGDGGDELFGGYKLYQVLQAQRYLRNLVPAIVRDLIGAAAETTPVGLRGRTYAMSLAGGQLDAVARTGIYLDEHARDALVPALARLRPNRAEERRRAFAAHGSTLIRQLTRADFCSYLPDDILVKVDRASMLTSLEVRAPFLDHRVVEFAFSRVPDRLRGTLTRRKVLLRHLAQRLLPRDLDLNRKQGFSIPLGRWFKGEWGAKMSEVLWDAAPGLFDSASLSRLIQLQRRGYSNTQRLFSLVMLELWRREYAVQIPTAGASKPTEIVPGALGAPTLQP